MRISAVSLILGAILNGTAQGVVHTGEGDFEPDRILQERGRERTTVYETYVPDRETERDVNKDDIPTRTVNRDSTSERDSTGGRKQAQDKSRKYYPNTYPATAATQGTGGVAYTSNYYYTTGGKGRTYTDYSGWDNLNTYNPYNVVPNNPAQNGYVISGAPSNKGSYTCRTPPTSFRFQITGGMCDRSKNGQSETEFRFSEDITSTMKFPIHISVASTSGLSYVNGVLNSLYDIVQVGSGQTLSSPLVIQIVDATNQGQYFTMDSTCSGNLVLGESYCGISIVEYTNPQQGTVRGFINSIYGPTDVIQSGLVLSNTSYGKGKGSGSGAGNGGGTIALNGIRVPGVRPGMEGTVNIPARPNSRVSVPIGKSGKAYTNTVSTVDTINNPIVFPPNTHIPPNPGYAGTTMVMTTQRGKNRVGVTGTVMAGNVVPVGGGGGVRGSVTVPISTVGGGRAGGKRNKGRGKVGKAGGRNVPITSPSGYYPAGTRCNAQPTRIMFQLTMNSCSRSNNYQSPGQFISVMDRPLINGPMLVRIYDPSSVMLLNGIYSPMTSFEIFSTRAFSRLTVQIWTADGRDMLQAFEFTTDCLSPLMLGDTFCGVTIGGFQNLPQGNVLLGSPGGGLGSPGMAPGGGLGSPGRGPGTPGGGTGSPGGGTGSPGGGTGSPGGGNGSPGGGNGNMGDSHSWNGPQCTSTPTQLQFKFTGDSCASSKNSQGSKFLCTLDNQPITFPAHVTIASSNGAIVYFNGVANKDDILTVGDGTRFCADSMTVTVRSSDQSQIQQVFTLATDCNTLTYLGDTFGALQLAQFRNLRQGTHYCCKGSSGSPPGPPPTPPPATPPPATPPPATTPGPSPPPFVQGPGGPTGPIGPEPTVTPTSHPTVIPGEPTKSPTFPLPTKNPTVTPTKLPTKVPTRSPTTPVPSSQPTGCRGQKCVSYSCAFKFQLLPDRDCTNSFNEQTSQYFICILDNPLQYPLKAQITDQGFTTLYHEQTVNGPYEIIEVGNQNLCPHSLGVALSDVSGNSFYKVFTINTSCETQPIYIGDVYSALKVVSFTTDSITYNGCTSSPN